MLLKPFPINIPENLHNLLKIYINASLNYRENDNLLINTTGKNLNDQVLRSYLLKIDKRLSSRIVRNTVVFAMLEDGYRIDLVRDIVGFKSEYALHEYIKRMDYWGMAIIGTKTPSKGIDTNN